MGRIQGCLGPIERNHVLVAARNVAQVWAVDLLAGGKGGGGGGGGRASPASPRLLHHEPDEAFHLSLWRSRSDAVVYLRAGSDTTHHLLYLNASAPPAALNFTTLAPKASACPSCLEAAAGWHAGRCACREVLG
jgi:hypothetical protein